MTLVLTGWEIRMMDVGSDVVPEAAAAAAASTIDFRSLRPVTFADLKAEYETRRDPTAPTRAGASNDKSALLRFMAAHGLSDSSSITPVMTLDFEVSIREFEEMAAMSMSAATVDGYASRLRTWHDIAMQISNDRRCSGSFHEILAQALDHYRATAAKPLGVTAIGAAIGRRTHFFKWLSGEVEPKPMLSIYKAIAKLEGILGVPAGTLSMAVVNRKSTHAKRHRAAKGVKLSSHITKVRYKTNRVPEQIKVFLDRLEAHKTSLHPGRNLAGETIKRAPKGVWRKVDDEVASSLLRESWFSGMVGWLMLPTTLEEAKRYVRENTMMKTVPDTIVEEIAPHFIGRGMSEEQVSPIHLVDPVVVSEYLEWRTARTGVESGGQRTYCAMALALISKTHGFITQQVELAWDYMKWEKADPSTPDGAKLYKEQQALWRDICAQWHEEIRTVLDRLDAHQKARDPRVLLAPILEHDDPMSIIKDIIDRHHRMRPVVKTAKDGTAMRMKLLAVWQRDQLLLRMLTVIPLRNRNFRNMTYKPDNTGNLYKKGETWHLRFSPREFKNERGAAKNPFDVPVPKDLVPFIEEWLNDGRRFLLKDSKVKRPDNVFVTNGGGAFSCGGLSQRICVLTAGYLDAIPEIDGFRSHAFRHIVATAWLKANPGDYLTVALILHDKLDTVLENYAHLAPHDAFSRYSSWMVGQMRGV